jgi:hypothetical protein
MIRTPSILILRVIHALIGQVDRAVTRILDVMEPDPTPRRRSANHRVPPMVFFTHHSG